MGPENFPSRNSLLGETHISCWGTIASAVGARAQHHQWVMLTQLVGRRWGGFDHSNEKDLQRFPVLLLRIFFPGLASEKTNTETKTAPVHFPIHRGMGWTGNIGKWPNWRRRPRFPPKNRQNTLIFITRILGSEVTYQSVSPEPPPPEGPLSTPPPPRGIAP